MLSRILTFALLTAMAAAQSAPAPTTAVSAPGESSQPNTAPAESGSQQTRKRQTARRRDPFVSIIQTRPVAEPHCAAGKKCLIIHQIVLKGVIKSQDGMLALVENGQRKSYFLREKDPVFNGEVVRITRDSIVFREKVVDKLGRVVKRDIVKTLPGPRPA